MKRWIDRYTVSRTVSIKEPHSPVKNHLKTVQSQGENGYSIKLIYSYLKFHPLKTYSSRVTTGTFGHLNGSQLIAVSGLI